MLELALADPDTPASSLRGTCEELLAYGQGQERLLEALLTLAGSEGELERREPRDLSVLATHVLLTPRPTIEALSLDVASSLAPAVTSGDAALFERLIANLIDNAAHHNIPGGRIEVETGTNATRAFVSVANGGPVIQPKRGRSLIRTIPARGRRPPR